MLNPVSMGRGKGLHAVPGTQGLGDLEAVSPLFARQVPNCVNTLICHRLNDPESVESVSRWMGTPRESLDLTAHINLKEPRARMGSMRANPAFIIHPDRIKQELRTGETFYGTRVGDFYHTRVKVHDTG